jgi:hypothetical protein
VHAWDSGREQCHGVVEVDFLDGIGSQPIEPYTAFDFVDLSTNLRSIGVLRVGKEYSCPDCDYRTIQAAIDDCAPSGNTVIVEPITDSRDPQAYFENIVNVL